LMALWQIVRQAFRSAVSIKPYAFTLAGIFFPLISLSASRYQLPHYIFVALPFVAVLMGLWLQSLLKHAEEKKLRHLRIVSIVMMVLIVPVLVLMEFAIMSIGSTVFRVVWLSVMGYGLYRIWLLRSGSMYAFGWIAWLWICVNMYLNLSFYPALLQYQPAVSIAATLDAEPERRDGFYVYQTGASHSLDFYTGRTNLILYNAGDIKDYKARHLITDAAGLKDIGASGISVRVLHAYSNYPVQFLSLPFLNPATRDQHIPYLYWVEVQEVAGS
jgi:hypothetical protein